MSKGLSSVKAGPAANEAMVKLKKQKAMIKMIILLVVSIITAMFRVCVPPVILSMDSCPEAAPLPMNLMHLLNFDSKDEQI